MVRTLTLKYHLPGLGIIRSDLYPSSTICYNVLNHFGHINRLKNIDHLGVIRKIYEGAHHPRWEYVMLQLGFLHNLNSLIDPEGNKIIKRLGLSKKNRQNKFRYYSPSGIEVLQMWILLLNSGHLPYTFASERAFLKVCKNSEDLKSIFLNGLPGNFNDFFWNTLVKEDIYSVHKSLMAFYLDYYKKLYLEKSKNPSIPLLWYNFLQKLLNNYLHPTNHHNQNLKNVFHKIRQMSYLFLDSGYSHFPLEFDITKIFLNADYYLEDIFLKPNSAISKTLDSLDSFLSINMYHSAETMREFGAHSKKIENNIRNSNISNKEELYNFLKKDENFEPQETTEKNTPMFHVLFDLTNYHKEPLIVESFSNSLSFSSEEISQRGYEDSSMLNFHKSANLNHMIINLPFNEPINENNIEQVGKFLEYMIQLHTGIKNSIIYQLDNIYWDDSVSEELKELDDNFVEEYKKKIENEYIDDIFQEPFKEITLTILEFLNKQNLHFEFKEKNIERTMVPIGLSSSLDDVEKNIDIVKRQIGSLLYPRDSEAYNSKIHELEAIKATLNDYNNDLGYSLLSLSEIIVHDNSNDIVEIDGLLISFKDKKLKLIIVEAKDQPFGHTKSLNALKDKMDVISFITEKIPKYKPIRNAKCAYLPLEIDGKVLNYKK